MNRTQSEDTMIGSPSEHFARLLAELEGFGKPRDVVIGRLPCPRCGATFEVRQSTLHCIRRCRTCGHRFHPSGKPCRKQGKRHQ